MGKARVLVVLITIVFLAFISLGDKAIAATGIYSKELVGFVYAFLGMIGLVAFCGLLTWIDYKYVPQRWI